MKKVAFVTPTYPVLSETFIRTEVDSISACGHDVCVMTFGKNKTDENFNYGVYKIGDFLSLSLLKKLTIRRVVQFITFISEQESMPKRSLFFYSLKLASQMTKLNVKHVHSHFAQHTSTHGIAAAKLMGISCSFVAHGHDVYESPFDIDLKIKNSDFVVAVCKVMEADFQKVRGGNIKLLHCGVKTQWFKPRPKLETPHIRLVFLGRLVEQKGVEYLIQSLHKLCNQYPITLDIIGEGELHNTLKNQVSELGLTPYVRFLGAKQPCWVKDNLPNYDCLVAPFCVAQSGCVDTGPLVLKEAMAVGIPVITSNIMGCKEIVSPETGFLVEQKSGQGLSLAIEKFVTLSIEERQKMGYLARLNVENNFDAFKQAKVLSGWIESHN